MTDWVHRPTILVVDDDRQLIDVLVYAHKRSGLDVVAAYDGPTALRLFEEQRPDLVTLGINPGPPMNGLDVLEQIRLHSQVPVIMLTVFDSEENKLRAFDAGADDYMTKPFSHRELVARTWAQLRRSGWTDGFTRAGLMQGGVMTRDWAHQRDELLAHVTELRERARERRDEAQWRQIEHGNGDELAQQYHTGASRLDLAATVLLGAIQLANDQIETDNMTKPVKKQRTRGHASVDASDGSPPL